MKVYADLRWPEGTGIGRMAEMYRAAAPPKVTVEALDIRRRIGSPLSALAVGQALVKAHAAHRSGELAVFWNPGFVPPVRRPVNTVVTVHDLTHLHFYTAAHRIYYEVVMRPLYRRCDLIVCSSEHTRQEFLEWSGIAPDRVITLPLAIDPAFGTLAAPLETNKPYLFYAGNRRGFKNVPNMVRAFVASGLAKQGFELVMTGSPDEELLSLARAAGAESALQFRGFLDDAAVAAHYRGAACIPYLSRYEGFGLPILESWACDTPVLLSNASCLPEVGGDAALYVDPDNIEQISEGMRTLCLRQDVRASLIERGRQRYRLFDPEISAARLWRTIADVAAA